MARRRQHSAEFKAKVAVLWGDRTLSELAATFGVHPVRPDRLWRHGVRCIGPPDPPDTYP